MTPEEATNIASRTLGLFGTLIIVDEFGLMPVDIGGVLDGFRVEDERLEQPLFVLEEVTRNDFNDQRSALGLEPFLDCPEARFYRCTTD